MTLRKFYKLLKSGRGGWYIGDSGAIRKKLPVSGDPNGTFQFNNDMCPISSLRQSETGSFVSVGHSLGLSSEQISLIVHAADTDNPETSDFFYKLHVRWVRRQIKKAIRLK